MQVFAYIAAAAYVLVWLGCARGLLVGYQRRAGDAQDWAAAASLVVTAAAWPLIAVLVTVYGFGLALGHIAVRVVEWSILPRNRRSP